MSLYFAKNQQFMSFFQKSKKKKKALLEGFKLKSKIAPYEESIKIEIVDSLWENNRCWKKVAG